MKNINNNVFFNKINERINNGDFDVYLTLPFMSRALLLSSIKGRLKKKNETAGTPILSDAELRDCIEEVKETALHIIATYLQFGFIEKTETGIQFTEKGILAIKNSNKT